MEKRGWLIFRSVFRILYFLIGHSKDVSVKPETWNVNSFHWHTKKRLIVDSKFLSSSRFSLNAFCPDHIGRTLRLKLDNKRLSNINI